MLSIFSPLSMDPRLRGDDGFACLGLEHRRFVQIGNDGKEE